MKVSFSNDVGSMVYFDHNGFRYYGRVTRVDGTMRRVELLAHVIGDGHFPVTGVTFLDVFYHVLRSHASPIEAAFRREPYAGGNPSIAEKLVSAYRYWRQHSRVMEAAKHAYSHHALAALNAARADVANGTTRFATCSGYGPAYKARGTSHMRWIEKPDTCGLRFVGYADKLADLRHTGYYVDNGQDEIVRGVVFQLPARHGKPIFVAGYEDWNNGKADSNGPVSLDFETIFEGESAYWVQTWRDSPPIRTYFDCAEEHPACRDAARAADQIAEWIAESEREYQAAWHAGARCHDLENSIAESRDTIKALLTERKAARSASFMTYPTICQTIERAVSNALGDIAEAREERAKHNRGDYVSEWFPGWNTRKESLRDAFKEGFCI